LAAAVVIASRNAELIDVQRPIWEVSSDVLWSAAIIIIIIIMEKTEAGHQWPLYPRNTFGI